MTAKTVSAFLLSALAIALFSASGVADTVSYTAAMDTSVGNPVTNIMIWETDGASTSLDYAFELPGIGTSVLSHDVPFAPTQSLVVGQTVGVDADGDDKTQIVMFLDDDFAAANLGQKFSVAFPNTRHSILLSNLQAAVGGDAVQLAWFANTFFPGDGAAAAFDTRGPFTVAEFTTLGIVGNSATAGNWVITDFDSLPWNDPDAQSDEVTAVIDETAQVDTGPFDIQLDFDENGILAIDKTVLNDTGLDWARFEMQLGTGLGSEFVPSTAFDSLAFVDDSGRENREETGAFPDVVVEKDRLLFTGALADGETAEFVVFVSSGTDGPHSITLRQIAHPVPEPAGLGLIGLALVTLRHKQRR